MNKIISLLLIAFPFCLHAQSYQKLHRKSILADTHNDVLSTATMNGLKIENDLRGKTHSDLGRFREGGIDVQVFSIFCDDRFGPGKAFSYANTEIDSLYAIAARNPDKILIVKSPAGIRQAIKEKKLAAMIGVEGGHMIEDNMSFLDSLYSRGARYMTLTWNNSTSWATSAREETHDSLLHQPKGLNDFGKKLVQHMNEIGMMVDLSHVGEQTFWDAIHATTKPVIASHSSVFHLCPHFRNLKDDQIQAIGKSGGVIFVNFYSGFIDSNFQKHKASFQALHQGEKDSLVALKKAGYEIDEWLSKKYPGETDLFRPPLTVLIDHIDYIVKMIGADHVGLGSDFDGIESAPKGLEGVQDFPLITQALLQRGYSKKDIRKILGGNFLRVFHDNQIKK